MYKYILLLFIMTFSVGSWPKQDSSEKVKVEEVIQQTVDSPVEGIIQQASDSIDIKEFISSEISISDGSNVPNPSHANTPSKKSEIFVEAATSLSTDCKRNTGFVPICSNTNFYMGNETSKEGFSFSEVFSGIALCATFLQFFWTRRQLRKSKIDSINEQYWLREIIIPTVMEPVIDLSKNAKSKFNASNQNMRIFYTTYYLSLQERLFESIGPSVAVSDEFYHLLEDLIFDLDDEISSVSSEDELQGKVTEFVKSVVTSIKNEQLK
jgi:hypothetical protein